MENEINININLSNERFISLFDNRIEENRNFNIINYINYYDYQINNHTNISVPRRISEYRYPVSLETWSSLPRLTHDEIVLPAFIEQQFLIPDDAVCGITLEKPECCTPCGHYFCRAEITRWLKQQKKELKKMTCPTCRAEIAVVIPDNTKREFNFDDVD